MQEKLSALADKAIELGALAMAFGRIDRTACYHPDQVTKESDSDHTVMLGWLAPALAAHETGVSLAPDRVATYALVHDAVEAYAGDTQTLRITDAERAEKAAREAEAGSRIYREYFSTFPWFAAFVKLYEGQGEPEARFVRALDKCLPKIVHLLDGCHGLHEFGVTRDELAETFAKQEASMAEYAGEFTTLMALRAELVARVMAHPSWT